MSACERCNADDIYGPRRERKTGPHHLIWVCTPCRSHLLNLPQTPVVRRDPLMFLPLAKIAAAATVLVAAILAIGAHW